jgi:hypothetical protein
LFLLFSLTPFLCPLCFYLAHIELEDQQSETKEHIGNKIE